MIGLRIDELPASLNPSVSHVIPSMKNGHSEYLSIQQIADIVLALVVDGSPEALDTLNELSEALGDDENFATNVTNLINARLKLDGTVAMTGPLNLGGNDVQNVANLVGLVGFFPLSTAFPGWLKCNGAAVSRTSYSALFAAIGTSFGVGDGSTTFNLPDLRGEFVRGFDDGRGIDSGRVLGSLQLDALQNMTGVISWHNNASATTVHSETGVFGRQGTNSSYAIPPTTGGATSASGTTFDASLVARTATETRGRNVALLACIKY